MTTIHIVYNYPIMLTWRKILFFKGFCGGKMYVCRDMFLFLIPLHIGGGGDGRRVRKNVTAQEGAANEIFNLPSHKYHRGAS